VDVRLLPGFITIQRLTWCPGIGSIQEVILPKAGILIYDTWTISPDDITTYRINYYKHICDCCQHIPKSMPDTMASELDEFRTVFYRLDADRTKDRYFDIQEQHLSYSFRQCQNPRDKVYGLLALIGDISDLDLWLSADYSKSEKPGFNDITCAMLHRDIYVLRGLTGAQNGIGTEKWASWVRDFGKPMTHTEAHIGSNRLRSTPSLMPLQARGQDMSTS
jgi:hypothetical protein